LQAVPGEMELRFAVKIKAAHAGCNARPTLASRRENIGNARGFGLDQWRRPEQKTTRKAHSGKTA